MTKFTCKTSDHTLTVAMEVEDQGETSPNVLCCKYVLHGHAILAYYPVDEITKARGVEMKDRWASDCIVLREHGLDPATVEFAV